MRAREGPFFMAEELGLEQPLRDRGAVDLDERLSAPYRCRVDGTGDEVFAHTALAPDQNRRVGVGDADRKSTRLNSSHLVISYAVFCLKKKKRNESDTISCDVSRP